MNEPRKYASADETEITPEKVEAMRKMIKAGAIYKRELEQAQQTGCQLPE